MERILHWGVIGTGNIARQFARAVQSAPGNRLKAVTSRSLDRSRSFGKEFGASNCHEGVASIVSDPEIDVIYVATPHTCHHEDTLACLNGGKHVLCEKPLAINAREAAEMIDFAAEKRLFLMEAMWSRFLPSVAQAIQFASDGTLGDVRILRADLGFNLPFDRESRVFNRQLGGGCLLDVGIYPIFLATAILGRPRVISGTAVVGITGVDEHNCMTLTFEQDRVASLFSSIRLDTTRGAVLIGTKGTLHMHTNWWKGGPFTLRTAAGIKEFELPVQGNGYQYEIEEVHRCLRAGEIQSSLMPLDQSLQALHITDELRKRWNLKYPGESSFEET